MALDVHKLENGKHGELLFQINDSMYALFEPAFDLFKKRTGLFIDPYGDLKFCSGLAVLIQAVSDCSVGINSKDQLKYVGFLDLLTQWESSDIDIVFLGD